MSQCNAAGLCLKCGQVIALTAEGSLESHPTAPMFRDICWGSKTLPVNPEEIKETREAMHLHTRRHHRIECECSACSCGGCSEKEPCELCESGGSK